MGREVFIQKFKVPKEGIPFLDKMFTQQEMDFVEQIEGDTFPMEQLKEQAGADAELSFYRRGIFSYTDETRSAGVIGDFYGRLDMFAMNEQEVYRALSKEEQRSLDGWYLDTYVERLGHDLSKPPTEDVVATLEETLAFIEEKKGESISLFDCDCKSLLGDCGLPKRVCIGFNRDGLNSYIDRGLGEIIDSEKAKEIVRMADEAGLMHTLNPHGICNCCGDCCYLFRAAEKRGSHGSWPASPHRIAWKEEECVQCESCLDRCHFQALQMRDGRIEVDVKKCVGCAVCASACPADALYVVDYQPEK